MKSKPTTHSRLSVRHLTFSLACLVAMFLFPQQIRANDTYSTHVTVHDYYGEVGHDGNGGHIYKAKVYHGHHYYYIYLHHPLPELRRHIHEKAHLLISRRSDRWLSIGIDGRSARIHSVKKIH